MLTVEYVISQVSIHQLLIQFFPGLNLLFTITDALPLDHGYPLDLLPLVNVKRINKVGLMPVLSV